MCPPCSTIWNASPRANPLRLSSSFMVISGASNLSRWRLTKAASLASIWLSGVPTRLSSASNLISGDSKLRPATSLAIQDWCQKISPCSLSFNSSSGQAASSLARLRSSCPTTFSIAALTVRGGELVIRLSFVKCNPSIRPAYSPSTCTSPIASISASASSRPCNRFNKMDDLVSTNCFIKPWCKASESLSSTWRACARQ